jgi:hypothetical protein
LSLIYKTTLIIVAIFRGDYTSIGVLLCKDKDSEVVEYALSRSLSPTVVAEYKTQLPDKKLLQQKLHELFEQADNSDI